MRLLKAVVTYGVGVKQQMARIALLGVQHESNANANPTTKADFEAFYLGIGAGCLDRFLTAEPRGFCSRFSELRDWTPIPILLGLAEPSGPVDDDLVKDFLEIIGSEFAKHPPVDGVFIFAHGAGVTGSGDDLDALYISRVREIVGVDVPIVAEIDPHANVSSEMLAAADIYVSYRTNPHIDIDERGKDCADILHEMLNGSRFAAFALRLPMVLPQTTQLTTVGEPMHDIWSYINSSVIDADIADLSVLTGCSFSDTPYSGLTIISYSRRSIAHAQASARKVADFIWEMRQRFLRTYKDTKEACTLAKSAVDARAAIVLADVADNPGGGGTGNTLGILRALLQANVSNCCFGIVYDPDVVADAINAGAGTSFRARFNRSSAMSFSAPAEFEAKVIAIRQSAFLENGGMYRGLYTDLGARVTLLIQDIYVAVCSNRHQCMSPQYFIECGMDDDNILTWVVKSRGHFRAGFETIVDDSQVFEVVSPGLTSPYIHELNLKNIPRPSFPIDMLERFEPIAVFARDMWRPAVLIRTPNEV